MNIYNNIIIRDVISVLARVKLVNAFAQIIDRGGRKQDFLLLLYLFSKRESAYSPY